MLAPKRTETELRDRLHSAIDNMSLFEIVVLIVLVQYVRARDFTSRILPRSRRALPEPEENGVLWFDKDCQEYPAPMQRDREFYGQGQVLRQTIPSPIYGLNSDGRPVVVATFASGDSGPLGGVTEEEYRQRVGYMAGEDDNAPYFAAGYCTPSRHPLTGHNESQFPAWL